ILCLFVMFLSVVVLTFYFCVSQCVFIISLSLCVFQGGGAISMSKSLLPFPYILYERMERAEVSTQLVFIRDNMELILGLYRHDNLSSASWDPVSTEHFLVSIGRQRDEISSCVSITDCRLRRYYNKLRRRTLSLTVSTHCVLGRNNRRSWS
uniref:Interferon a3-like n=1 Tax=Gouania willdenowi TaxID=441366 RepID=A0A8C5EQB2_GOUWI